MILTLSTVAPDPWEPWETQNNGKGHHPAAPEPASWGIILVGFALCLFAYVRFIRPRSRCCGGKCERHQS